VHSVKTAIGPRYCHLMLQQFDNKLRDVALRSVKSTTERKRQTEFNEKLERRARQSVSTDVTNNKLTCRSASSASVTSLAAATCDRRCCLATVRCGLGMSSESSIQTTTVARHSSTSYSSCWQSVVVVHQLSQTSLVRTKKQFYNSPKTTPQA